MCSWPVSFFFFSIARWVSLWRRPLGQQVEDDKDKDPVRLVGQQASDFLCPLGHHAEHDDVKALPGGLKVGDLLCPLGQEVRDFSRPVGHQAKLDDVKVEPGGVRMLKWGLYLRL